MHFPWARPATGSLILPSTNQSLEKAAVTSRLLGTGMERRPRCLAFASHNTGTQTSSAHLGAAALQAAGPVPENGWEHPTPADAVRGRTCSPIARAFFLGGGDISGCVWGEWDEGAMQDIPAPPSPRPSGCVLMPPHSRLSQSSGFSLSAGGSPNSALYGCSWVKLRIVIKYYHNGFSLYCLVLLLALVS